MKTMHKVTGYTLSYCPWCKKAKQFFAERNIPIDCVDYDLADKPEQARILREIKAFSGGDVTFPYVVIDDTPVMGLHTDRYIALLGLDE